MNDNEICPVCGAKTVLERDSLVLTSLPPWFFYRAWCGCGWRGEWEKSQEQHPEVILRQRWERLNEN